MDATENPRFKEFMKIVDKFRKMSEQMPKHLKMQLLHVITVLKVSVFSVQSICFMVKVQRFHYSFCAK
jgi:hypothetical protein